MMGQKNLLSSVMLGAQEDFSLVVDVSVARKCS